MTDADDPRDRFGRRIADAATLRAVAHAGRYALLERLQHRGPATASECAEAAGMSPSACSYHLRRLAAVGLVEPYDDPARQDGRERVWRSTVTGWRTERDAALDPREGQALDSTLVRVMLDSSDAAVLRFTDDATEDRAWKDSALVSNSGLRATPEEVQALGEAIMDLLAPYLQHSRQPEEAPEGARPVHAAVRLVPRAD